MLGETAILICPAGARQSGLRDDVSTSKCGNQSTEITCAVTSLPPARTAAGRLNSRLREHWHIENANHDVRDLTDDEDRCRARVTNLPQNLAALTNIAISIIRLQGRFEYIAQFNR